MAAADRNGFLSPTDEQLSAYGNKTHILETIQRTWRKISPLYDKIHAVARHKLQEFYGKSLVTSLGAIPAHICKLWLNPDFYTAIVSIISIIVLHKIVVKLT